MSIEVQASGVGNEQEKYCVWRPKQLLSRRDYEGRVKLVKHCLFIFMNFLQQLAILSSQELISFPEEWLIFFQWLNVFALLDFLSLFDVSNDLALIFKIVVTTLLPLAITGVIGFVLSQREAGYDAGEGIKCCRYCRICCTSIFGALALVFLVVGSVEGVQLDLASQQIFVFIGILRSLYVAYEFCRTCITWQMNRLRETMGEHRLAIYSDQTSSEVYVWLFLLVSLYASVFKSVLSFVTLPGASVNGTVSTLNESSVAIQISGIVLSSLSALFILRYTYRVARSTRRSDYDYGALLTKLFEDRFWYFQVVIMVDKSIIFYSSG